MIRGIYRMLLRLYPAEFREEFGEEMYADAIRLPGGILLGLAISRLLGRRS